jgi:hypothetical protein
LDRDGKLSNKENRGADGRAFLETQLVKSGQLLGNLWLTAYRTAPEDTFLEKTLQTRAEAAAATTNEPATPSALKVSPDTK